jgi:hypothetical protein
MQNEIFTLAMAGKTSFHCFWFTLMATIGGRNMQAAQ